MNPSYKPETWLHESIKADPTPVQTLSGIELRLSALRPPRCFHVWQHSQESRLRSDGWESLHLLLF